MEVKRNKLGVKEKDVSGEVKEKDVSGEKKKKIRHGRGGKRHRWRKSGVETGSEAETAPEPMHRNRGKKVEVKRNKLGVKEKDVSGEKIRHGSGGKKHRWRKSGVETGNEAETADVPE